MASEGTAAAPATTRLQALIDRLDGPMLVLAAVSVGLHLADLKDFWAAHDLTRVHEVASLSVDAIFLADLLVKAFVLRRPYLLSAWFFIDLISTLPVLSSLAFMPGYLEDLRVLRGLRVFRIFRTLRLLRVMRALRILTPVKSAAQTPEGKSFERALFAAVALYTAAFAGLMASVHMALPDETAQAREIEFYAVVASLMGMAVVLGVVHFQIPDLSTRQLRALLNIALPHQVAEYFMKHPDHYDQTVRMPATIVFTDIRGFSRAVEKLHGDLEALKKHLERVMDTLVEVHQRYDLIVDKFIGDAVMSFRGGDLVAGDAGEHAWRVVRASLESARAVQVLSNPHFQAAKIGGASAEQCLIGTFGTSRRLSYTVLGDAVNLAARLEPASGQAGARNLFCETTYRLTRDREDLVWRRVGRLRVPGKDETPNAYEAFDRADGGEWLARFHDGLAAFEARRLDEARRLFVDADAERTGGDGPSRFYMDLCAGLTKKGFPPGWQPLLETHK